MRSGHDYLLITNNPLVVKCMGDCYPIEFVDGGYSTSFSCGQRKA